MATHAKYSQALCEIRVLSVLLGSLSITWALIMFKPPETLELLMLLISDGAQGLMASGFLFQGCALILGAMLPWRKLRHVGLVIGVICWFSIFGAFLQFWVVNVYSLLFAFVGAFGLFLFHMDVLRKPREECPVR